jgi:hypothetical protein
LICDASPGIFCELREVDDYIQSNEAEFLLIQP